MNELARIVEALLFLSPDPLPVADLAEACEVSEGEVVEALARLREHYAEGWRGVVLREVAGGFTLATDPVAERAARRLLARPRTPPLDLRHMARSRVTVEMRLAHLRSILASRTRFSFDEAVKGADRLTEAMTVWALLELYKAGEAQWEQEVPFGPITVVGAQPNAEAAS